MTVEIAGQVFLAAACGYLWRLTFEVRGTALLRRPRERRTVLTDVLCMVICQDALQLQSPKKRDHQAQSDARSLASRARQVNLETQG